MAVDSVADFFDAVGKGDAARVKEALEADPSLVDARNDQGIRAILLALYYRHDEVLEELLASGPELDVYEAAATGQVGRLRELLDGDPSLAQSFGSDGFTALGLATYFGKEEAARLLLDHSADPNATAKNQTRVRPIHSAIANRNPEEALALARLLIERGAEINVAQEGGWTPLHQAAAHGQADLVKILLDRGADPGALSADGRAPEQMAREGGFDAVADRIREASTASA